MTTPTDAYEADNRAYYDAEAPRYDAARFADAMGQLGTERTREMVGSILRAAGVAHALEVGSGTGRVSVEIGRHVGELTLIDISPEMLQAARSEVTRSSPTLKVTTSIGSAL